jgi:hypothetical protein
MVAPGISALPRDAVVAVASAATYRAKVIAIVNAAASVGCVIAGIGVGDSSPERNDAALVLFWVALFALVAVLAARRASRATLAARRAASDVATRWTLVGNLVVATDERGQPAPEHSFKITRAQRSLLR